MFQDMAEKSDFLCIKCGADSTENEGTFCFNCGYELDSKYCSNEMCDRNNGTSMQMPRNYCFCDVCGSESSYLQEGFISPQDFDHSYLLFIPFRFNFMNHEVSWQKNFIDFFIEKFSYSKHFILFKLRITSFFVLIGSQINVYQFRHRILSNQVSLSKAY